MPPQTYAPTYSEDSDAKKRKLLELLQQKAAQQEEYPLSFAQQRLWFLDQWMPNSALYNVPFALQLKGNLDMAALKRSLDEIVRRHEILRTAFVTRQDEPVQVISPVLNIEIPLVDLSALDDHARKVEIERLLNEEARQPFDLPRTPLLRHKLLRLSLHAHLLAITAHHIIFDGWSSEVMINELAQLYEAFAGGRPSPLPEIDIQYADFSEWQRDYLQGEVFQKQLAYWKAQLEPLPPILELPTDRPRPASQTFGGAFWTQFLPADLFARLEAFCQQEKVSMFMLTLAVLDVLLYRYTKQTDIVVGMAIANRNRPEIEKLIGFFVNMLPLRIRLDGAPTFREVLGQVRQASLAAYTQQDMPFEKLVEALGIERNPSHSPIFQVMLVLESMSIQNFESPDMQIEYYRGTPTGTAKYDLSVIVEPNAQPPCISFEYNIDLFDAETVVQMANHYQTLLENAVAQPDQKITDMPMLSATERRRLLEEWGRSGREYPADVSLHEAFRAQAAQTPTQTATVYGDQTMTYQDLDNRSGNLADLIRRLQQ